MFGLLDYLSMVFYGTPNEVLFQLRINSTTFNDTKKSGSTCKKTKSIFYLAIHHAHLQSKFLSVGETVVQLVKDALDLPECTS